MMALQRILNTLDIKLDRIEKRSNIKSRIYDLYIIYAVELGNK